MTSVCACVVAATGSVSTKSSSGGGLEAGDVIAIVAIVVTLIGIGVTIWLASKNIVAQQKNLVAQQVENRRQERAKAYAEAIRAVEDYLETPYRVRRRDGSTAVRRELTESISEIQSRINFHQGWLRINAPEKVYNAYVAFVHSAKKEAGGQMTEAWNGPVTEHDQQIPLGEPLEQPESKAAKEEVLKQMRDCLKS